ncbi:MAG: D-glycero-beta-D-manno-heptose 1-phosphate adenylyltransferase [Candidatus Lokiarchaeota archaeon]|nr:D-glycero-beta-D-manno-heptose 1-phosphate adenylyltransferase [Candidatus Lokiarchaeota archaeon]
MNEENVKKELTYMKHLIQKFDTFKEKTILVIGDIMLDEYVSGAVTRINPEAPVPVVNLKNYKYTLGGASNLAFNIKTLTGKAYLSGIIGNDEPGMKLIEKLKSENINSEGVLISNERPTTTKRRIVGNEKILVRIDDEITDPINIQEENKIISFINKNLSKFDGVILSDYLKGTLTKNLIQKIIKILKENKKLILADTKSKDLDIFKGINILMPNKLEAENASGIKIQDEKSLIEAGIKIINNLQLDFIIIKLSNEGMTLIEPNGKFYHFKDVSTKVIDVSGAGDTAISSLALSLTSGMKRFDAVNIANIAASVVVEKMGTATVTLEELKLRIYNRSISYINKIKTLDELKIIIEDLKKLGKKIVFTNGCFDILHVGHIRYFHDSKALGDYLVVGLNSDSSVRTLKGEKRPIVPEEERAEMLSAIASIDYIVIFPELTPINVIETLKPHIQTKGNSYSIEKMPEAEIVKKYGGKIVLIKETKGRSTTIIVEKILKNYA